MKVAGYCPMGCGETLFLGSGGYVTCSFTGCPRPDAAAGVLNDREAHHTVRLDEAGFTIRHPLRERLDDELMRCSLHRWIARLNKPRGGVGFGMYRVRTPVVGSSKWADAVWEWEET
jgi:hypothetical protein